MASRGGRAGGAKSLNRAGQGHESKQPRGNAGRNRRLPRNAGPRRVAYEVSARIGADSSFANLILPKAIAAAGLDSKDAAFCTELVYGMQRWRGLVDAVIAAAARRPADGIDVELLDLLRLGAFQLLFMDVPAHAAVSETVDLAGRLFGRSRSGFVNAVMRRVSERPRKDWEAMVVSRVPKEDVAGRLAVRWSHPVWIVRELSDAWDHAGYPAMDGDPVAAMLERDNEAPDVTLVARPGLIERDELASALPEDATCRPGALSPYALRVRGVNPERLAAVREGRAGVEDEGSQMAALTLAGAPLRGRDQAWLDMCAGPGGKTALLAALAAGRGASVTANEPSHHRAQLVRDNLRAMPAGAVRNVLESDGRALTGMLEPGSFDRVLVDAPCSGLGSLRRRPEARWNKTPEALRELTGLQAQLLRAALTLTRPGGVVAYVTCSPALAETRGIVDGLPHGVAEPIDTADVLRGVAHGMALPGGAAPEGARTGVQLFEHLHDTDQMFVALLRRTDMPMPDEASDRLTPARSRR